MESILDPGLGPVVSLEDISTIVGGAGGGDGSRILRLGRDGPSSRPWDSLLLTYCWQGCYCYPLTSDLVLLSAPAGAVVAGGSVLPIAWSIFIIVAVVRR